MLLQLLQFRLRQSYRFLKDIGGIYIVLVILLLAGYLLRSVELLLNAQSYRAALVVAFIFLMIHLSRSDQHFLKLLNVSRYKVFISEYFLFSLPFNLIFLFTGNYQSILVLVLALTGIGFLPAPGLKKSSVLSKLPLEFISVEAFAIRAGIRKQALVFIPIYLSGIFLGSYREAIFVVIFILSIFIGSFFEEIESPSIISKQYVGKNFIVQKIITNSIAVHLLFAPLYFLFLFYHPTFYYLLFPILVFVQLVLTFSIGYKYSHYYPGRRKVNNALPLSIFCGSILIPFFIPIPLTYAGYYFAKARKNMHLYYA